MLGDGMLKLMLILLAFFVFLNSQSEFSAGKAVPILQSLAERFAAVRPPGEEVIPPRGASKLEQRMDLRRRLLGHLPISAAAIAAPGALVTFDLETADLFAGDGAALRHERRVLLNRLASALSDTAIGQANQLVLTTHWPDGPTASVAGRFESLRAGLAAAGLESHRLHFGFADLPAGSWRFSVRPIANSGQDDAP